jgi:diguanylate cyclase (GGDEF)-like protein/PAS domain S-box-containing protein
LGLFAIATGIGVQHERTRMLRHAHEEAQQVAASNLDALAVALWSYDERSLAALLQGMVRTGTMVRIEVLDEHTVVADTGQPAIARKIDHTWTLPIMALDRSKQIGSLRVSESYVELDQQIASAMGTVVATELAKIVGLVIVLFVIVYRQIARHLARMAQDVVALNPNDLDAQVVLHRDTAAGYHDELDTLTDAINRFLAERASEMHRRSRAENSLRENVAEMDVVLGALSDCVIALDRDCKVRYANTAARAILGMPRESIGGQSLDGLLKVISELSGREMDGLCQSVIRDGATLDWRGNVRIRTVGGQEFDARIRAVPAPESGDVAMIFVFTDISAEIGKERQIEFQALHDPLTELGNRAMLARDLTLEIERAKRDQSRIAVLCVDLDNFKNINDALGHTIGDIMLKELAQRFQAAMPDPGWVTRHGGDEFIMVLPLLNNIDLAARLAEALMANIAKPFRIEGHELRITSSVGISLYPDHGQTIGELVSNADMAMYEAKRAGRNAYRFYEIGLLSRSSERLVMENGLRVALAEKQFSLAFQPKVAIATSQAGSLEALLRWHTAPGGPISPAVFIPVAEDMGLIGEIGEWVLRESLAAALRLRTALGFPVAIAVNVSPLQFRSERLINVLQELAAQEADLPRLLEIELTENALAGDIAEVTAKLQGIKTLGLKIAIDDFGTGYSSLAYLKNFPIDLLKIDQAFIRDLHRSEQDKAIVSSVVHLGKSMGFGIIAEGVEEQAHVAILAELGCEYAQGYWFARPMPESDIVAWLTHNRPGELI